MEERKEREKMRRHLQGLHLAARAVAPWAPPEVGHTLAAGMRRVVHAQRVVRAALCGESCSS